MVVVMVLMVVTVSEGVSVATVVDVVYLPVT